MDFWWQNNTGSCLGKIKATWTSISGPRGPNFVSSKQILLAQLGKKGIEILQKDLFRVVIFSSNDPNYVEERSGFYICKNETGPELLPSKSQLLSKYKLDEVCEKGFTIFVPKTETDFAQVMKTVDTTNLLNPFRLGSNWEVMHQRLLETKHCSE